MLYFIPSWYHNDSFREQEQYWFRRRLVTEFDDTVKQIQLFNRNNISKYKILLLSFAPNFRHFLHRQSVFHAPYWSCFDAIQEITRLSVDTLSFHDLLWPEHIEFMYTPFCVIANLNHKKFADIHFAEDGNMIEVIMYKDNTVTRKNTYDDRGFLSSTIVYENGKPLYEQYLNVKGIWKICHFFNDNHIEVNPKQAHYLIHGQEIKYKKLTYGSMGELITEVFTSYIEMNTDEDDIFCLAMHPLHYELLDDVLYNRKKILSFYQQRLEASENLKLKEIMENARYIIVDSRYAIPKIKEHLDKDVPIIDITPFDTRVDFGISQQLTVQNILVPVDRMTSQQFEQLVLQFVSYFEMNETARVHFFTRKAQWNVKDIILEETKKVLEKHNLDIRIARKEDDNKAENDLDHERSVPIRFYVDQCVDELAISKTIRLQRLMVDVTDHMDLYLIISCISAGIPMILHSKTQYMEDHKNGLMIQSIDEIPSSLSYYLDGLNNWNKALVASYEIGKKYNTKSLISKWKEVMIQVDKD